jgi:hypothetical protein
MLEDEQSWIFKAFGSLYFKHKTFMNSSWAPAFESQRLLRKLTMNAIVAFGTAQDQAVYILGVVFICSMCVTYIRPFKKEMVSSRRRGPPCPQFQF